MKTTNMGLHAQTAQTRISTCALRKPTQSPTCACIYTQRFRMRAEGFPWTNRWANTHNFALARTCAFLSCPQRDEFHVVVHVCFPPPHATKNGWITQSVNVRTTNRKRTYACAFHHTFWQTNVANSILRARMHIRKHSIAHTPEHHKQINTHNHAHARTCTFGRAHKIILFHVVACIVPPVVRLCVSCYVPGSSHLYWMCSTCPKRVGEPRTRIILEVFLGWLLGRFWTGAGGRGRCALSLF